MQKLIVFLKAPRAGLVKTRLAQAIGGEAACAAYRGMVHQLLDNLASLPGIELRFTPDEAFEEIKPWLGNTWSARPQGAGDLGTRLQAAFAESFGAGAQKVVVIGSDCPAVTEFDIQAAWAALGEKDAVVGPAHDGGYWLIGLRAPQPALFQNISWSSDKVLAQTLARARALRLAIGRLRQLSDVDTQAEWREFRA